MLMRISATVIGLLFTFIVAPSAGSESTPPNAMAKEDANRAALCEGLDGLNVSNSLLDGAIQKKLNDIYQDNKCYIHDAVEGGPALDDGKVGLVTKRWVNQALMDFNSNKKASSLILDDAKSGIRPYVLLEPKLTQLQINQSIVETLTVLSEDDEANLYVTEDEAWQAINKSLTAIEGFEALAPVYENPIRKMIKGVMLKTINQDALNALVADDLEDEAKALQPLLGKPISEGDFKASIENTLEKALAKADKKEQATLKDEVEKKIKDAVLEVEVPDTSFKLKLDEITALGDDVAGLKDVLKGLVEKAESLVKVEAITIETIPEEVEKPLEADMIAHNDKVLKREIKKHEDLAKKYSDKGEPEKADDQTYIANQLKLMFHQEKARIAENEAIRERNDKKICAIKKLEQEAKTPPPPIAVEAAVTKVEQAIKAEQRYKLIVARDITTTFPGLPKAITDCAKNLLNQVYPSAHSLGRAVDAMVKKLDDVAWNMENPTEVRYVGEFSCTVDMPLGAIERDVSASECDTTGCDGSNASSQGEFSQTDAKKLIVEASAQPFYSADLNPISLNVLPNCTDCSLPMRGINYGFYPYWQASDAYAPLGLATVNPAAIDFSVFTRMAYFAIPIEDDGAIKNRLHWRKNNIALVKNFVQTLTRYNVKRDIILYSKNWCHWGQAKENQKPCSTHSNKEPDREIKQAIMRYAEDHYTLINDINNSVQAYGGISGVTLYFDDYTSASDVTNIINYVQHFKKQMSIKKQMAGAQSDGQALTYIEDTPPATFDINLMLGIKGLSMGSVYVGQKVTEEEDNYFLKLKDLFLSGENDQELDVNLDDLKSGAIAALTQTDTIDVSVPPVKNILVFLNENTSAYKKSLRLQVENEFSGSARVDAQEAIIPIMGRVPLGEESSDPYRQALDDIAYFKYNFGGIGVWSLPFTSYTEDDELSDTNVQMTLFSHILKKDYGDSEKNYMEYSRLGIVGEFLHRKEVLEQVDVCGEVCPKRDLYSKVFIGLIIICLLIEVFTRISCSARSMVKKIKPTYATLNLALIAVFFALLGCHPAWQAYWGQIISLPIVCGLAYGIYSIFSSQFEE